MSESWSITIDYMMIVGKYFRSNRDYINAMKVCKKYKHLVLMYRYNPISDCRLFKKIETQHFYVYSDIFYRLRDMYEYVYWINKCFLKQYINMIDSSRCTFKNPILNKMINHAYAMGYISNKEDANSTPTIVTDVIADDVSVIPTMLKQSQTALLMFEYNGIFFGFKMNNNPLTFPRVYNSILFMGSDELYNNALVLISESFTLRIYVRDTNFDELMCIYVDEDIKIEISEQCHLRYNLPMIVNVINFCLIQYDKCICKE